MYKVNIEGFKTKAQAEAFVSWYEGQGEQDIDIWLECRKDEGEIDVDSMKVDCRDTYPLQWNENILTMIIDPQ